MDIAGLFVQLARWRRDNNPLPAMQILYDRLPGDTERKRLQFGFRVVNDVTSATDGLALRRIVDVFFRY